jgi:hypothetical protein
VRIFNEGWGDIEKCVLEFNIANFSSFGCDPYEKLSNIDINFDDSLRHKIEIAKVSDTVNIDLSAALIAEGVLLQGIDMMAIAEGRLEFSGDPEEEDIAYYRRPFDNNLVLVYGRIRGRVCASGDAEDFSFPFATTMCIYDVMRPAAPSPPTFQYQLKLDVDRENYTAEVPLSQSISPGDTDRFTVVVGNEKSALHSFRISFRFIDGLELCSEPIFLRTFVPRSARETWM